jgi:hypothetical protein
VDARSRWTEAEAQRRLAAWRASGLSLMAYCRREGVGYERVRRWRGELESKRGPREQGKKNSPRWLPVEIVGARDAAFPFELELSQGRRLRIAAGFDSDALAQLLALIEARA